MQAEKLIEMKRGVLDTLSVPAVLRGAALHLRVLLVVVRIAALQQITCDQSLRIQYSVQYSLL